MATGDAFLEQFRDAAPFLRMTELEKMKLANEQKVGDGKKFVWVSKSDEAYTKAQLQKIEDGTAYHKFEKKY